MPRGTAPIESPAALSPRAPIQVLLVEDAPEDVQFMDALLTDARMPGGTRRLFEVHHAGLLSEALALLEGGPIDVVLLDLHMPDSRGLETLVRVRHRAPTVPVVVLTGLADQDLAVQAVREGAQDYLVKGEVPLDLITRSVRYAIERQRAEEAVVRAQVAQAEAEAALRSAKRVEAQRRRNRQRELRSLERLSGPRPASTTAQAFGVQPLSRALPQTFQELVSRYADLMDLALDQRAYKVDHHLSDTIRSLADELGFLNAGPRDIVELHTSALRSKLATAAPQKAQAYVDEGRVMVLELMGDLVAYYRS
jgi:CheY-like chemotaxis protein